MARVGRGSLIAVAAVVSAVPLPAPASAAFPGRNGKLAISVEDCPGSDRRSIRAYASGGRRLHRLTPCTADRWGPDWSPRGRLLGFGEWLGGESDSRFGFARPNGRRAGTLREPAQPYSGPSFAPGGQRVLFAVGLDDYMRILPVRGGRTRELLPSLCRHCGLRDPHFSPGGRTIAFVEHGEGTARIRTISARTGRRKHILARRGLDPDWAPGGRRVAFTSYWREKRETDIEGGDLYVVRADGTRRRLLMRTEQVVATEPTWSPDGRWIAYIQLEFRPDGRIDASLWRVRARGGPPRRLTDLPDPFVDKGFWNPPQLAWQPLPRRR